MFLLPSFWWLFLMCTMRYNEKNLKSFIWFFVGRFQLKNVVIVVGITHQTFGYCCLRNIYLYMLVLILFCVCFSLDRLPSLCVLPVTVENSVRMRLVVFHLNPYDCFFEKAAKTVYSYYSCVLSM